MQRDDMFHGRVRRVRPCNEFTQTKSQTLVAAAWCLNRLREFELYTQMPTVSSVVMSGNMFDQAAHDVTCIRLNANLMEGQVNAIISTRSLIDSTGE
jgi:hypothetical protein